MILSGPNDQLMVMAAHRYCLGRASYIPGACMEWIFATWGQFSPNTQNVMLRDTLIELGRWPDMAYADEWRICARRMWELMGEDQRAWVRGAVAYQHGAIEIVSEVKS